MEMILVCIIAGVLVAFAVTGAMKNQLRSVHRQNTAGSYVVEGSFRLSHSRDLYLYKNVIRHARPQNNRRHGGRR